MLAAMAWPDFWAELLQGIIIFATVVGGFIVVIALILAIVRVCQSVV